MKDFKKLKVWAIAHQLEFSNVVVEIKKLLTESLKKLRADS